jgi:chloramphenicol-sensitive protein RarD
MTDIVAEVETNDHPEEGKGILFAGGAYAIWGVVPLYWRLLTGVGPIEITIHRVLWCAITVALVTLARGRFWHVMAVVRTRHIIGGLVISSLLITANWTIFIYCVSTHQLVEASLGYYMTPLVSIALGVTLLGEKISRLRLAAIGLAGIAVIVMSFSLGHIPWIAPSLALSFGFYGYMRKLIPVDALDGLTIETCLLFPLTLVTVLVLALDGAGAFPSSNFLRDALLIGSGPLTAVPLVLFAAGARRVRLTTLGFLQYFSPTISLLLATVVLGEAFTRLDLLVFACVWAALVLVGLESQLSRSALRSSS